MIEPTEAKFSLVTGGPFYRLQQHLGLLGPDLLPPMRTALLFALVAWLPPAILSVVQGGALSEALGEQAFFLDFSAPARFLIAIAMFTIMERVADQRITSLLQQFLSAGLVPPEQQSRFQAVLQRADRRTSSALAEIILLIIACAMSVNSVSLQLSTLHTSWLGTLADGNIQLTLAGWWALLFSLPLFWFLFLRWLWRFVVWTLLLRDIAGLKLRLVATHPDRSGGIGFMELFPPTFAALVFALSCVTASIALQKAVFSGMALQTVSTLFVVWLILISVIFVGPLLVFLPLLARVKDRALLVYGTFATAHNLAFEAKWMHGQPIADDVLGTPDISSLADLMSGFEAIRSMRLIPIGRNTFLPLIIAAGLPWLAVVATQVPLVELLSILSKALL